MKGGGGVTAYCRDKEMSVCVCACQTSGWRWGGATYTVHTHTPPLFPMRRFLAQSKIEIFEIKHVFFDSAISPSQMTLDLDRLAWIYVLK